MMLPPFALNSVARTLNHLLARDPAAPARLATLEATQVRLTLDHPPLELQASVHDGKITLSRVEAESPPATVRVRLTPDALGALLGGASVTTLMATQRLPVEGNINCLTQWHTLLTTLDIDGEGRLARVVGDIPAHFIMEAVRQGQHISRHTLAAFRQDSLEYVTEEARWVAGSTQRVVLRDQLRQLSTALDRAEARLDRLTRQLEKEVRS